MLARSLSHIFERLCVLAGTAIITFGAVKQVHQHVLSSVSLHTQDPPGYQTWASKWIFGDPPTTHQDLPEPAKTTMGTSDDAGAQIDGGIHVGEKANTQYKGDFINPVDYGVKPIYTQTVTIFENHGGTTGTIVHNHMYPGYCTQDCGVKGASDRTIPFIWGFLLLMVALGFRCLRLCPKKRPQEAARP